MQYNTFSTSFYVAPGLLPALPIEASLDSAVFSRLSAIPTVNFEPLSPTQLLAPTLLLVLIEAVMAAVSSPVSSSDIVPLISLCDLWNLVTDTDGDLRRLLMTLQFWLTRDTPVSSLSHSSHAFVQPLPIQLTNLTQHMPTTIFGLGEFAHFNDMNSSLISDLQRLFMPIAVNSMDSKSLLELKDLNATERVLFTLAERNDAESFVHNNYLELCRVSGVWGSFEAVVSDLSEENSIANMKIESENNGQHRLSLPSLSLLSLINQLQCIDALCDMADAISISDLWTTASSETAVVYMKLIVLCVFLKYICLLIYTFSLNFVQYSTLPAIIVHHIRFMKILNLLISNQNNINNIATNTQHQ